MASTTSALAKSLLKSGKSLPQLLRGRISGTSNISSGTLQTIRSLLISNQILHIQKPLITRSFPAPQDEFSSSVFYSKQWMYTIDSIEASKKSSDTDEDEDFDSDDYDEYDDVEPFDSDGDDFDDDEELEQPKQVKKNRE